MRAAVRAPASSDRTDEIRHPPTITLAQLDAFACTGHRAPVPFDDARRFLRVGFRERWIRGEGRWTQEFEVYGLAGI
eukprot:6192991-Pleurochrysis_carterae.AAC.2